MIRGVNRQIIEVKNTGSIYFERALLVVNPVFSDLTKQVLEKEARQVLQDIGQPDVSAGTVKKLRRRVSLLLAGISGAAAVLLILLFAIR